MRFTKTIEGLKAVGIVMGVVAAIVGTSTLFMYSLEIAAIAVTVLCVIALMLPVGLGFADDLREYRASEKRR